MIGDTPRPLSGCAPIERTLVRMSSLRALSALLLIPAALLLAGCAGEAQPAPTETVTAPPVFDPNGGAAGNLLHFQYVIDQAAVDGTTQAELGETVGAAGYAGWPMESTSDGTTLAGVAADAHRIAVLGPDQLCLIGQVTNDGTTSAIVAEPMKATGKCMIGQEVQ